MRHILECFHCNSDHNTSWSLTYDYWLWFSFFQLNEKVSVLFQRRFLLRKHFILIHNQHSNFSSASLRKSIMTVRSAVEISTFRIIKLSLPTDTEQNYYWTFSECRNFHYTIFPIRNNSDNFLQIFCLFYWRSMCV